jgi:multiple sugar transport system ATP-binding protein
MNLRRVALTDAGAKLGNAVLTLPTPAQTAGRPEVVVGIRPEAVDLVASDARGAMPMQVTLVEQLGADSYVHGVLATDDTASDKPFIVRVDGRHEPQRGDTVSVAARGAVEHVFDPQTGDRIG